jgi:hypothetical protein
MLKNPLITTSLNDAGNLNGIYKITCPKTTDDNGKS